jgi:hypothetical protein
VAPSAQLTEQPATQVTLHVDPALHEMLPLAPSVIAQVAWSPQSTLHESPHAPAQFDCIAHASVQLPPQVCVVTSQLAPAAQAQLAPVHAGGLLETLPQASGPSEKTMTTEIAKKEGMRAMIGRCRDPKRIRQRRRVRRRSDAQESRAHGRAREKAADSTSGNRRRWAGTVRACSVGSWSAARASRSFPPSSPFSSWTWPGRLAAPVTTLRPI